MIQKRYFAAKDSLGFPIPGTVMGYNVDPCNCNLVELKVVPDEDIVGLEDLRINHPNRLHYYYQVDKACCNVLPNSLIVSNTRPRGRYREFINYLEYNTVLRSESFIKNDCGAGFTGSSVTYSKTYAGTDQLAAEAAADGDLAFDAEGQANANANGTCTPV